jgi:acetyl esterase/lipase
MDEDRERVLAFPRAPDAIELRHLRSFVAVAEELNFGRAAEQLYLSQPALSRQIRALEQFVGVELFRRSTHQVELTLAGEALLDRARSILRGVDEAVSVTQSVGGELVGRSMGMWKALADLSEAGADVHAMRDAYEALHAQFAPPPEVTVRPVSAGGVSSLLVSPPDQPQASVLYLHGGGYMLGSAFGYRHLAGALAMAADSGALVSDYRLAPEHRFPAALDDALSAYRWLLDRGADRIVVAGDSSGGGLALSLLLSLKRDGLPQPAGAVLFCPGVDLSRSPKTRPNAEAYLGAHPPDDPIVSPLTADLRGLPPLLVQVATGDEWCEDGKALVARAREQGVDARLELYPVATHVFQVFWSFLPEATEAIETAGRFTREVRTSAMRMAG